MPTNTEQEGLIISNSNTPIIRAGFANTIFLLLLITLILVNRISIDLDIALFPRVIILLIIFIAIMKVYTHSVSRILIKDGKSLVIVGPFSEVVIDSSVIEITQVYGIPSSMTIFFLIKKKNVTLSKIYFFVALSTNYGSYSDTKSKLISILHKTEGQ